jgi:hypothetical protein
VSQTHDALRLVTADLAGRSARGFSILRWADDDRKEENDTAPLGVPLRDLLPLLHPTSINASLDGTALIARHELYTMRIEVVPPENRESENGPIRAVVRVTSELPSQVKYGKRTGCAAIGTEIPS